MSDKIQSMLGRIPSGLFILTAQGPNGEETGMLASWVQQAGFSPPSLTVGVNNSRYLRDWLTVGAKVALSQLGETQKSMLAHFGKGFEPGAPAFDKIATQQTPGGLTVLEDAIGWIEGKVSGVLAAGDHDVILIEVTEAEVGPRHTTEKPWTHLRKNGMKY
jgi:3-hydroxy-9,10-secoandrosta-1,3,5(10)-triene-9,17-dione monooxygenase reductase component